MFNYRVVGVLFVLFCYLQCSFAQSGTLVTSVEAESGTLSGGVTIGMSTAGYSGSGYVTNFTNTGDKVTVTVTVPSKAFYTIIVRYSSDDKYQDISVNGNPSSSVHFPKTTGFTDVDAGKYIFNAGVNTVTLSKNWGWCDIDKFSIYTAVLNTYHFTPSLVDSNATAASKSLYNFLLTQFGKKIISGQTDGAYYDTIKKVTGKSPLVRTWDFNHYTEGYPYLWKNGGFSFGIDPNDRSTENAISWYNSTGKKGIVGFHWHWCSPSGGTVGTNTFYTQYTTFDVTKAVTPGTAEYTLIIRDIDAIAAQLKKLQTAGVPILWRPLHEAGGGWFWWGAKGATACKNLYAILFDRLNNYHHLHNLIWEWSTPETTWYPGNNTVDIVGFDSYPGNYNYGTQKNMLDGYNTLTGGKKIIAMSENGPIPNPDDCLSLDAPWSYFMSWNDLVMSQNDRNHLKDVYNNPNVLSLENDTIPMVISAPNDSICAGTTATLNASANFGSTSWYTTSTGGAPIITGTSFTSAVLSKDSTFYVDAAYHGITSGIRNAIAVKVSKPIPTSVITGSGTVCQGTMGTIYSLSPDANVFYYTWTLPLGVSSSAPSTTNTLKVNFSNTAQSGNIIAKGHNACGDGPDNTLTITVNPTPPKPTIVWNNITLQSSAAAGNQWYLDNGTIKDSVKQTFVPVKNGNYYVIVTLNSCPSPQSDIFSLTNVGINDLVYKSNAFAIPNPTTGPFQIYLDGSVDNAYNIEITNTLGDKFQVNSIKKDDHSLQLDLTAIPNGIYFIRLETNKKRYVIKVYKTQ
jgi:mannan endo-1,4-beta-mannosidase